MVFDGGKGLHALEVVGARGGPDAAVAFVSFVCNVGLRVNGLFVFAAIDCLQYDLAPVGTYLAM